MDNQAGLPPLTVEEIVSIEEFLDRNKALGGSTLLRRLVHDWRLFRSALCFYANRYHIARVEIPCLEAFDVIVDDGACAKAALIGDEDFVQDQVIR